MKNPFTTQLMASVRKDEFGITRWGLWLQPGTTEQQAKYAAHAINQHDKLVEMLTACDFSSPACPECGADDESGTRHIPDCKLAALLEAEE